MLNVRLAGDHQYGKLLFTWQSLVMSLMVFFLCCLFFHEMSWMRSGTKLSQFLRVFLPTLVAINIYSIFVPINVWEDIPPLIKIADLEYCE